MRDRCEIDARQMRDRSERKRRVGESNPQTSWVHRIQSGLAYPCRTLRRKVRESNPRWSLDQTVAFQASALPLGQPSCLAIRESGGSGDRTHAGITRPRRSKPMPYHSAIPPYGPFIRLRKASDSGHDEPFVALVSVASLPECGPRNSQYARYARYARYALGYRDDDENRLPNTYVYDDERSYAAIAYRGRRACT
jgi:hypothetical protein